MNNIRHIYQSLQGRALLLSLMLLLCLNTNAQTTGIVIGGDVYGGGNQGAVGTDNVVKDQSGEIPANAIADPIHVHLNTNAESNTATSIAVYDGTIRTIFGGGQNGRTYGSTSVTIQGAGTTIARASTDTNLEHGGVFGAGDGVGAYVFGHSNVLIKGGTIAQNVYGGGNKADLMGTTLVRLQGGTLNESVFGGSRLANIYGYSLVDIDGANAAENLIIKAVYGGNDIAGHIKAGSNWDWTLSTNLQLRPGIFSHTDAYGITKAVNNLTVTEYNSFVHSSPEIANGYQIFVGQVFGGGNGDYGEYTYNSTDNNYYVTALGNTYTVASKPEVEKSYIELRGGTFGYVYGGGNNATVTQSVDICLDNSTSDPFGINADRLNAMGIATNSTYTITGSGSSAMAKPTYQFDRVFGGNNKAEMKIQPTWHLLNATINDLYSGGNEGKMTWKQGLLLVLDAPGIEVNTVYGGCRRANVEPMENGVAVTTIPAMEDEEKGYNFPEGFSARIFITDGTINNVYGGNDISGIVYGGNALDIQHSILGDVYGGGNGSYAYTDNSQLASHEYYRDFYYTIPNGKTSAQALNDFRPNAQQAWIHVAGTAQKPTLIGGSLYCGGNSATLSITEGDLQSNNKRAELNIGSYVIVDNVFLGSNGANMIANDMLDLYDHGEVDGKTFSGISMSTDFSTYIEGVSLGIRPTVSFDNGYIDNPNSTQIGSFYLGGNLGSITASGTFNITFNQPIIIYDKLVAGCNDANYKSSEHYQTDPYNIDYKGGITNNTGVGSDGVKVQMNINKVTLLPKKIVRDDQNKPTFDENGIPVLTWNKTDISEGAVRLKGANIYGGCYSSGYINGGVVININGPCMNDADIFITQTAQNSGIEKDVQQQDVFGRSMSVFGGGMGEKTEIWGNTTINIAQTGYILQAFGGGEKGTVGKDLGNGNYTAYNATINLNGGTVDEVYGGGFEGYVSGNTTVNVYSGKAVDVFGGACNADVGGYASVYVGGDANGASNLTTPIVRNVFGGNDYSGSILGTVNKTGNNNETVATNTYVEYLQGQVDTIFGGSYGSYPEDYALQNNAPEPPFVESTFVNFKPNSTPSNKVKYVFGGGWGDPDIAKNNEMQQRSYVLVNAPDNIENFVNTDIFGAGAFSGLGMNKTPDQAASAPATVTAKVVLVSGKVNDVYGSSYQSGFTRRTEVNVPTNSTINVYHIFGGGYGKDLGTVCDTYEATVNYNSNNATVRNLTVTDENGDKITYYGAIYGGNNNTRRTLYSFINIESPVWSNKADGYTSTVYGAGCGEGTWTQYTEVNLKNGANVYQVYGGGEGGMVLNKESVNAFDTYTYKDRNEVVHTNETVVKTIGSGYDATDQTYDHGGLDNALVHANRFPLESGQLTTNTNVYVWKGATVAGYAYGAGLGETALVSGTAYFGVHGGTVVKDVYAAGTSGAVSKLNSTLTFTPKTYAYLEGGSVRNIYGGGWKGDVGYHNSAKTATSEDIEGTSYVVIGTLPEKFVSNETGYNELYGFYKGVPTVQRNAYAGGEGGAIRGTANLTMNNGYIGFEYNTTTGQYDEKIVDETHVDNEGNFIPNTNLQDAGNIFGGGYAEKSDVDESNILMLGGIVRNSLYGGGEIATVGRASKTETLPTIHKAGKTHVEMYAGNVYHDVFGGGRGYDNLGRVGKELHTDGYVFGSTEVYIYGGNVGTASGAKEGYGNVFGGGNVGYVYSSKGTKSNSDGYYYDSNNKLTEDCKVIVSPYAKVLTDDPNGITLKLYDESHQEIANSQQTFYKNQYVPTEYLNCLSKEFINNDKHAADAEKKLDWVSGINIYNAVFAGGNVSAGSNAMYANTKTVFGNATATLNDVYHCDLITVGTEHIGGLYGDGNLTFVDGYRELNITNYGTDYYGQDDVITLAQYNEMNDRERAYFELKYKCLIECTDNNGKTITVGSSIPEDELRKDFAGNATIILSDGTINSAYFIESGFCNIYAGRLLNTIQRADFVGVFGSRMVLQGARDRVPSVVDYTDYTINRVGEVSLNQKHSRAGDTAEGLKTFGNYFGIYSIVNYLGALTSDVEMTDKRTTKNTDDAYKPTAANQSYEGFKIAKKGDQRVRNNGSSINKVALAAGVYLEITKEGGTPENKIWGEATGVMELDLINVMPGLGGGYVYAKNVHGERSDVEGGIQVTLSPFNEGANSKKKYTYTTDDANAQDLQTSGNFVHSTKPIFDDCYPQSNSYTGNDAAPAHYWFIKGQIYLYNQYISAYTGAADAYEKTINIPLTITAGSHGKIKLQNVQPNKYAYYSSYTDASHNVKLTANSSKVINDVTYNLNDTITYWEWSMLSETDQKLFVDETYVTTTECKIGETTYAKGSVFLPSEVETLKTNAETKTIDGESVKAVYHTEKGAYVAFTDVFHPSNNISHDNGYILTYNVTNPIDWDSYYSPIAGGNPIPVAQYDRLSDNEKKAYIKAPTYSPDATNVYGQRQYNKGEIITKSVKDAYDAIPQAVSLSGQASFERAYVLTRKVTIQNEDNTETYLNEGYVMSETDYTNKQIGTSGAVAYFCNNTLELKRDGYDDYLLYYGKNLTQSQIRELVATYICYEEGTNETQIDNKTNEIIRDNFTESYFCTEAGLYGGSYFESTKKYSGLSAWSSLPEADREHFHFNYDDMDLLIDPDYHGDARYYDTPNGLSAELYALEKPVDYSALYTGTSTLTYVAPDGTSKSVLADAPALSRTEFEEIPNERYHYAPFEVKADNQPVYIVNQTFIRGDVPYTIGNSIDADTWSGLGDSKDKIDVITGLTAGKYYYCRDSYAIETTTGRGTAITTTAFTRTVSSQQTNVTSTNIDKGSSVHTGVIIDDEEYEKLINKQASFTVFGKTPVVTSTLYVSGQSNIKDLSKGKIITVIYQYNYEESDASGSNIEPITERHIVNIHIDFKSGTPTVGQLGDPSIVLPGSSVGLSQPSVKPGAFEVIGGGWELFASKDDAEKHINGVEFDNDETKLYWYQNNVYQISYYAKTYLGKTYSNPVSVKVANYHDLDMVMRDKEHHMYIDNPNVERNSKIYFDGNKCSSDQDKSKLDLLKDLFDLSLQTITLDGNGDPVAISGGELDGHIPLDNHVKGLENLEFIMRGNVAPKKYTTWSPIGSGNDCFEGNLHADGYTISGLDHSLFGSLCGNVYNLGVTGTFTESGISENGGYAENCWIMTTGSIASNTNAVMAAGVAKNCYYPDGLGYTNIAGTNAMTLTEFRNGTVAYNLNGFYLDKRFADNNNVNTNQYKYYEISDNTTNTLNATPSTGGYAFAVGDKTYTYGESPNAKTLGYVESRYIDGDFIYAGGTIPTVTNERRYYVAPQSGGTPDPDNGLYYPIWPDDYLFFGQMLTYGYTEHDNIAGRNYQATPSRINKEDRSNATQWLVRESLDEFSNRVYRAPAYYGSKNPDIIHYNAYAVVPAKTQDGLTDVYPNLTAIDFTAISDYNNSNQVVWNNGWSGGVFNKRVLDHSKLTAFRSDGQTQNLLAYALDNDAAILRTYFNEPVYSQTNSDYKTVDVVNNVVKGHLVLKQQDNSFEADGDHFLVDKQDFNAPIEYSFGQYAANTPYHMWYQRTPDNYVMNSQGGWETISLPFTAELVTTQQKGEITHFYSGSTVGHEYWLREYNNVSVDENDNTKTYVNFKSLAAVANSEKDVRGVSFLWDYYYNNNSRKDKNADDYQQYYQSGNQSRIYSDYPLLTAAKPYLIGFPGKTYYEFDLSGEFLPSNTATSPASAPGDLDQQVITFVSVPDYTIGVTDDELGISAGSNVEFDNFTPTYQTKTITNKYHLNVDENDPTESGKSFVLKASAQTVPFRAYIDNKTVASPAPSRSGTRADILYIGYSGDVDDLQDIPTDRGLYIYGENMNICVESTLDAPATVTITTVAGRLLKQFTIQPGTKVRVPVNNRGVYIVNRHKIAVTR